MNQLIGKGLTGKALADVVIDHVLMYPDQHDQSVVFTGSMDCGSMGCIAGWSVMLHHGWSYTAQLDDSETNACVEAARLLDVPLTPFYNGVYQCASKEQAIANLKELMNA